MASADDYEDEHVEEDEPSFGEWLNEEMNNQGVSIADLVAKTGISYAGIWNISTGKTYSPRQETRDKLAKALKKKSSFQSSEADR